MNHMERIDFLRKTKTNIPFYYACASLICILITFFSFVQVFSSVIIAIIGTIVSSLFICNLLEKIEKWHMETIIQKQLPKKQVHPVLEQLVYADIQAQYVKAQEKQIKQKHIFHPAKQENVIINVASTSKEPLLVDLKTNIQTRNMQLEEKINRTLYSEKSTDSSDRLICKVCSDTIFIAEGRVSHPCNCPSIKHYKNTQS